MIHSVVYSGKIDTCMYLYINKRTNNFKATCKQPVVQHSDIFKLYMILYGISLIAVGMSSVLRFSNFSSISQLRLNFMLKYDYSNC